MFLGSVWVQLAHTGTVSPKEVKNRQLVLITTETASVMGA